MHNDFNRSLSNFIFIPTILILITSCSYETCQAGGQLLVQSPVYSNEKYLSESKRPIDLGLFVKKDIISSGLVINIIKDLNLTDKDGKALSREEFNKNLIVKTIDNSDVVIVSYKNIDKLLAKQIVNSIMINYRDYRLNKEFIEELRLKTIAERQKIIEKKELLKVYNENLNTLNQFCQKRFCKDIDIAQMSEKDRPNFIKLKNKYLEDLKKYNQTKINNILFSDRYYLRNVELIEKAQYHCYKKSYFDFYNFK